MAAINISDGLRERFDTLMADYNENVILGRMNTREEFLEKIVSTMERYEIKNGEIGSFFDLSLR